MNKEQKILRLLEIAVENRWEGYKYSKVLSKIISSKSTEVFNIYDNSNVLEIRMKNSVYSLNDLISNFNLDEMSFSECLGDVIYYRFHKENNSVWLKYKYNVQVAGFNMISSLPIKWNSMPTEERLDWLFDIFIELL